MKFDHKTSLHDLGNVRVICPLEIIKFPVFFSLMEQQP